MTIKKLISSNDEFLIMKTAIFAIGGICNCSWQKYRVASGPESHQASREFHFTEKGVSLFMRLFNPGSGRDTFKLLEGPVK